MSDTDNAARRERAKKWFDTNEVPTQDDDDWASNHTAHEIGWAQLIGYLAGAREEAKVKDQIIRDLSDAMEVGKEIVSRSVVLITDRDAEIAALREQLKDAHAQIEGLENELIEVREMSDE